MNKLYDNPGNPNQQRLFVVDPGHLALKPESADNYDAAGRPDVLGRDIDRVVQLPRTAIVDVTDGTAGARPFNATLEADMERRGVALPPAEVITPVYEQTQQ